MASLTLSKVFAPKETSEDKREKAITFEKRGRKTDIETGKAEGAVCHQRAPSGSNTLATWAATICILCTVVNCFIAFKLPNFSPPSLLEPIFSITREQFRLLRQSSLINGINNNDAVEPVDTSHYPHTLILAGNGRYTEHQDISLSDGISRVNRTASTIIQFGAVHFGIEHCELGLQLTPTESVNTSITAATELPFSISIYQLEQFSALDANILSHSVLPRRLTNIGDIDIVPGLPIDWRQSLNCARNEVLTFEIACSEHEHVTENNSRGDCSIEWWQKKDQEDPSNAVFMIQHAA